MNDPDRMKRSPTVSAQSRWAQVILALSALGTYGLMFFPTYHWMGRAATTLAVLPVAMFGWLLGMRGGLLAALFCLLSNMILLNLVGQPGWEVMIHTGGGSLGAITLVLIGGIVGRMSDLGRRAERELAARQRAEEALREERQLFIGGTTVVFKWKAVEGWPVEYVSPNVGNQFGYAPEELTCEQFKYAAIVHPDDLARVAEEVKAYTRAGVPCFEQEYRIRRADGEYRWVYDFTVPVRDGIGAVTYYHGYVLDITERKQAEEALRESEADLNRAQSVANTGSWHLDIRRNILSWSAETYRIFGVPAGMPLTYESFLTCVHPEDREFVDRSWQAALQGAPYDIEHRIVVNDQVNWVRERAEFELDANGLVKGGIGTVQDITERKRMEAEQDRLLQDTRRRAEELAVLTRLSREITVVPELQPALTLIARHAAELSGSDAGGVFAFGADERLRIVAAHGVGNEFVAALNALGVPPGHGAIGRSVVERRPIQISDVLIESGYPFSQLIEMEHIRSVLAVPMLRGEHAEGEVIGGIVLWHRRPRRFTPQEVAFVHALAQQCVNAVENARLFESERAAREQAETLRQVAQVMSGSLELENVLHRILGQLKRVLTYDTASVLLLGEADQPALVAGIGYADEQSTSRAAGELLRDSPILRQMANDLRLVNIAEVREHPGWTWVPGAEHVRSFLAVPIVAHHRMTGALMVDSIHPNFFKESDERTAQTLAQHMAIAIENARRYEETRQQAAELAVLAGASQSIQSGGDLPEVLDAVLRQACDLMSVPTGSILLLDESGDRLRVAVQRGLDEQAVAEWNRTGIPGNFGTFALVLGTGEMLEIPDARHDPRAAAGYGSIPAALTNVPLLAKGRVIGILVIEGVSRDDSARRVLYTLAEMAGVAIERARLFDETRRRAEELESLAEVASAMRTALTVEEMLPLLVRKAAEAVGGAAGSIFLVESETGDLVSRGWLAASDGWRFTSDASLTLRHRPGEGVTGRVAATGEIYITRDLQHDPLAVFLPGEVERLRSIQSGISLPLRTQARIVGVLHIWRHEDRGFDETEVRLLTSIAEMAGNAIHRAALYEQTERDAVELALAYDTTIEGWSKALDLRDKETEGHTLRVTQLTERLARSMGISGAELVHIHRGALLHDIGKMGVPDSILLKPGALTAVEWEVMRMHPVYACEMLSPITYLHPALEIPYCHHEKWDGTGYPRGLKGEQISLTARIFAVVDVYDALRSDRPYRKAWSEEKTLQYIRDQAGRHFDPKVVEAFMEMLRTE